MKLPRRLSDADVAYNLKTFNRMIDDQPKRRRERLQSMLAEPVIGEQMLTAPASPHEDYHSCFPGGLLSHSLNVVLQLKRVANALAPHRFDDPTLEFVGLFHDFGKIGDGEVPYYVPNENDWERGKGRLYRTNELCVHMPTSERGLYVLQKHGVVLTSDEYLAIRLNDGQYVAENKPYSMREPDLALLVHFADRWACSLEK